MANIFYQINLDINQSKRWHLYCHEIFIASFCFGFYHGDNYGIDVFCKCFVDLAIRFSFLLGIFTTETHVIWIIIMINIRKVIARIFPLPYACIRLIKK